MSMLALKLAMAAAGSAGGAAWEGLNSLYFKWNNNVFPSNRQSATGVNKVQTTHPYNNNLNYATGGSGNQYTNAIYMNAAGTLYYTCIDDNSGGYIKQFELTSAYDFKTMIPYAPDGNNAAKALGLSENAIKGLYFKSDGSRFYILGTQTNKVYRYDMSTNWDVASASKNADEYSYFLSNAWGLWFESTGDNMFICIYGTGIRRHGLSTSWDLSTVSTGTGTGYEYSDGQDTQYGGVSFSADGTKLYRAGGVGTRIYQSTLSSAWNLSTASYTGSFTNSELLNNLALSRGPSNQFGGSPIIDQNNGSRIIYGSKSASLNRGLVVDMATLSTPYLISSASYATAASTAASRVWIDSTTSNSSGTKFIYFVNDGSAFFTVNTYGPYIRKYTMSTPYDLSSAPAAGSPTQSLTVSSVETQVQGFSFKPDGKVLLTIGGSGNGLDQWNLGTAWDLSTASHAGFQFVDSDNFTFFSVKPDGTQIYYNQGNNGTQPRRLNFNTITNPWDITGGISSASSVLLTDNSHAYWSFQSGKFSDDGKQFYIVQTSQYHANDLTQWTLSTGWDFSTFNSSPSHRGFYNLMYGLTDISFADDGKKMFLLSDVGPNAIYRYDFVA
jgi:hypothetical protein